MTFISALFYAAAHYHAKQKEIPVGSEVILYSSSGTVSLPIDLDAEKEYRHALGADNKQTLTRLVLSGRLLLIDSGTKARTVDDGPFLYKVMILSGRYIGQTGYLEDSQIRYTKP